MKMLFSSAFNCHPGESRDPVWVAHSQNSNTCALVLGPDFRRDDRFLSNTTRFEVIPC